MGDVRKDIDFRSAIHPVTRAKSNDINPSTGKVTSTGNIFRLTDYKWASNQLLNHDEQILRGIDPQLRNIPRLTLTEFQPRQARQWQSILLSLAVNLALPEKKTTKDGADDTVPRSFKERLSSVGSQAIGATIAAADEFKTIANTTVNASRDFNDTVSQMLNDSTKVAAKKKLQSLIMDIPMELVRNLFSGRYMSEFELPYVSEKTGTYLHAQGDEGWKGHGPEALIGEGLQQVISNILPTFNFPTTPTWELANESTLPPDVDLNVYLLNESLDDLVRNFQFLHSFLAGAFWTQVGVLQKSPNLYDVRCPGRFHHYFCKMNCEVTYAGKSRSLGAAFSSFEAAVNAEGALKSNLKLDQDSLFPDVYKLKIKLSSLMPNNFNTYLDYLIQSDASKITIGNTSTAVGDNLFTRINGDNVHLTAEQNLTLFQHLRDAGQGALEVFDAPN